MSYNVWKAAPRNQAQLCPPQVTSILRHRALENSAVQRKVTDMLGCGSKSHCLEPPLHSRSTRQAGTKLEGLTSLSGTVENCSAWSLAVQTMWMPRQNRHRQLVAEVVAKVLMTNIFGENFDCFVLFSESEVFCRLRRQRLSSAVSTSQQHAAYPNNSFHGQSLGSLFPTHTHTHTHKSLTALIFILTWTKITFCNPNIFHRVGLFTSQPYK